MFADDFRTSVGFSAFDPNCLHVLKRRTHQLVIRRAHKPAYTKATSRRLPWLRLPPSTSIGMLDGRFSQVIPVDRSIRLSSFSGAFWSTFDQFRAVRKLFFVSSGWRTKFARVRTPKPAGLLGRARVGQWRSADGPDSERTCVRTHQRNWRANGTEADGGRRATEP